MQNPLPGHSTVLWHIADHCPNDLFQRSDGARCSDGDLPHLALRLVRKDTNAVELAKLGLLLAKHSRDRHPAIQKFMLANDSATIAVEVPVYLHPNEATDLKLTGALKDEKKLLDACADSRSRSLLPAVLLALNTGMRYSELRPMRWSQVDLERTRVRVGKSKTEAGTGRVIPLNDKATEVLKFWADQFPDREPEHFVFASERYGAGGNKFEPTVYNIDPTKAINSWKEAWESVKEDTGVSIRFHDLPHTCVTRMLEGGVPLSVVASILGGVRPPRPE